MTSPDEISPDPNAAVPVTPHPTDSAVTLQDVRHVATLANLELTPDEEAGMLHDMNAVLEHVAKLQAIDTAGVPPMTQVGQLLQVPVAPAGGDLRVDTERPSSARSEIMHEAPETDGRFFKVPKVIER